MRALLLRVLFITATLAVSVTAQTHKVAKPEQVVRAIGVYEWTGDFAKPTASRLIPVSLYIEGKLEDAGIYTARPVPFALLSGNVYLLQNAGVDKGTLDLAYARHLQAVEPTGDMAFDDGWFGYGSVKPLAAPRKTTAALKPSKTVPVITATPDPNRPHLVAKPSADSTTPSGTDQSKPASTQSTNQPNQSTGKPDTTTTASGTATGTTNDDADRPTMKRRTPDASSPGTSSGTTTSTTSTPADDPDRPTMKRRTPDSSDTSTASTPQSGNPPADDPDRPTMKRSSPDSGDTTTTASTTQPGDTPNDDADRPTLKRHTPAEAKKAGVATSDINGGGSVEALNNDPNRPNLHHGKPTGSMTEEDLPKLSGIPPNLHQMVAVSDAVNRDPHPFTLEWDDDAQHQAVLQKMQTMARAQLAAYATTPATGTPAAPAPAAKKPAPASTRSRRAATAPAPPPVPLLDEQLKAYTLSYGGDPTYVYSANTGGTGAALRYVTIVAQADSLGQIRPAIQSVTDAAHLYRAPRMQFVDVVDAEASNRASLLFELRSQNARQFALYRVIAAHPEQIFLTGTTQ
jgi:hypothetical protein